MLLASPIPHLCNNSDNDIWSVGSFQLQPWPMQFSPVPYSFLLSTSKHYTGVPGECARLRENVPYVKVHRSNPKHLHPKLNCYGDNGEGKVWSSCGSTYYTCFACCYPYTAHVRPSVSQPSQADSAFIINRCHSYGEL